MNESTMTATRFLTHESLSRHPMLTEVVDDHSGVSSFVLSERVTPHQKGMYFMAPSIRGDGRWWWVRACEPPEVSWDLCAVSLDPDRPAIHRFTAARMNGNGLVEPNGDTFLCPIADGVYRVDAQKGVTDTIVRIPRDWLKGRMLTRLVTDLTLSADGKRLMLDSRIGNRTLIWTYDMHTGETEQVCWFDEHFHHTFFSSVDPDLFMLNRAVSPDEFTGDKHVMGNRTHMMRTDLSWFGPMRNDQWFGKVSKGCHEWFTSEGLVQWCDYRDGIYEQAPLGGERSLVWKRPLVHGQVTPCGRYLAGDENPYEWNEKKPCSVWLFDRQAGKEVAVAYHMPHPLNGQWTDWRALHADPHPCFSDDGEALVYTTGALGKLDAAIMPMDQARQRLEAVGKPA